MNKLDTRTSSAGDEAPSVKGAETNVTANYGRIGGQQTYVDRSALHNGAISGKQITTEQMTAYLHGVAAASIDEIEALMERLRDLQENLAAHCARVEQGTARFLELNKSIGTLTNIISDGAVQTEAKQPAAQPEVGTTEL